MKQKGNRMNRIERIDTGKLSEPRIARIDTNFLGREDGS